MSARLDRAVREARLSRDEHAKHSRFTIESLNWVAVTSMMTPSITFHMRRIEAPANVFGVTERLRLRRA